MAAPVLSLPILKALSDKYQVILASGSQRRQELMDRLNLPYKVIPSTFAEDLDKSQYSTASQYTLETATRKTNEVYERIKGQFEKPLFIIGADTIVVNSLGQILEKPSSMQDARDTLKGLGGKTNEVITAVCLVIEPTDGASAASGITQIAEVESTEVVFADLDDDIINAYVDTGEPMDKAGSYAYQSLACFFIKEIKGDFYNVMGFPCAKFYQILVSLHQKGYF